MEIWMNQANACKINLIYWYIYIFIILREQKTLMKNITYFENYDEIFNDRGTWNIIIHNYEPHEHEIRKVAIKLWRHHTHRMKIARTRAHIRLRSSMCCVHACMYTYVPNSETQATYEMRSHDHMIFQFRKSKVSLEHRKRPVVHSPLGLSAGPNKLCMMTQCVLRPIASLQTFQSEQGFHRRV